MATRPLVRHHRGMDEHMDATTEAKGLDAPSHVRRLTRRTDRKVLAGVCAGLGDYFAVDPVLFRIGFILLAVLGGAGVLVYVLAWLIMPAAPADGSAAVSDPIAAGAVRRFRDLPGWVGVGLLILGAAILADEVGLRRPGIVWGVALIALGVLLFLRNSEDDDHGGSVGGSSGTAAVGGAGTAGPAVPPPPPTSSALAVATDAGATTAPLAQRGWRDRWPLRPRQE